jgi:hypothetical protein
MQRTKGKIIVGTGPRSYLAQREMKRMEEKKGKKKTRTRKRERERPGKGYWKTSAQNNRT